MEHVLDCFPNDRDRLVCLAQGSEQSLLGDAAVYLILPEAVDPKHLRPHSGAPVRGRQAVRLERAVETSLEPHPEVRDGQRLFARHLERRPRRVDRPPNIGAPVPVVPGMTSKMPRVQSVRPEVVVR